MGVLLVIFIILSFIHRIILMGIMFTESESPFTKSETIKYLFIPFYWFILFLRYIEFREN